MSEVSIINESNKIEINNDNLSIEITKPVYSVAVASLGVQGIKGDTGEGATTTWNYYAMNAEYNGTEVAIVNGDVLEADFKGDTIYRFINSTNNANGYPSEDSFYSDFDGTNLTNLLATRGI